MYLFEYLAKGFQPVCEVKIVNWIETVKNVKNETVKNVNCQIIRQDRLDQGINQYGPVWGGDHQINKRKRIANGPIFGSFSFVSLLVF